MPSVKVRRGDFHTLVEILKGSLDEPMTLKLVGAPNRFRYVAGGDRMRGDWIRVTRLGTE